MEITYEMMRDSAMGRPFGTFEPFLTGTVHDAAWFCWDVVSALERLPGIQVRREYDHYGSGYASYVSVFLHPSDGSTRVEHPTYFQTTGILLWLSRLAPIAVYGASSEASAKDGKSSSSGFIVATNLGVLPEGDWEPFLAAVKSCLDTFCVEILPPEPLLRRHSLDFRVPSVFDDASLVFDTLFYWCD